MNDKQRGIGFKMYLEARGELRKGLTVDYQAMNEKQLRQYLEVRREFGEKPTHKISLEEVEALYQSKLAIEEITPKLTMERKTLKLPTQVKTLKTLRALSC